jgi:chemotaxis methyl-accepting protein methylase
VTAALDEAGFLELTAKIARERDFRCGSYKEKCLRRRIAVRMRARGVHSYADYARILDGDSVEWDKLMDALTINVTKLFRNWETYSLLADTIVPGLWAAHHDQVKVWSAGCSSGEEPYSLATLFHRAGEKSDPAAGADPRHRHRPAQPRRGAGGALRRGCICRYSEGVP